MGSRRGERVPRRRGHPPRPEGSPAAALRRGRGRGGPRAARGARPAVRATAAVPRLQGGVGPLRRAHGRGGEAVPPHGRPRAAVRRAAARGAHRHRSRPVRRDGCPGAGAQAGARGVDRAHPHAARQRARAGGDHRRPAASAPDHDLPCTHRRLRHHAARHRAVPRAPRALPRAGRHVRADHAPGRPDHPLDGHRGDRDRGDGRVRRRARGRSRGGDRRDGRRACAGRRDGSR